MQHERQLSKDRERINGRRATLRANGWKCHEVWLLNEPWQQLITFASGAGIPLGLSLADLADLASRPSSVSPPSVGGADSSGGNPKKPEVVEEPAKSVCSADMSPPAMAETNCEGSEAKKRVEVEKVVELACSTDVSPPEVGEANSDGGNDKKSDMVEETAESGCSADVSSPAVAEADGECRSPEKAANAKDMPETPKTDTSHVKAEGLAEDEQMELF